MLRRACIGASMLLVVMLQPACGRMPIPEREVVSTYQYAQPISLALPALMVSAIPSGIHEPPPPSAPVRLSSRQAATDTEAPSSTGQSSLLDNSISGGIAKVASIPAGNSHDVDHASKNMRQNARQDNQAGDPVSVMLSLEHVQDAGENDKITQLQLRKAYLETIEQQQSRADLPAAEATAERALRRFPGDKKLLEKQREIRQQRDSAALFRAAQQARQVGDMIGSYHQLEEVLRLYPAHAPARQALNQLAPDVVDLLHRDAMQAYRHQQLEPAIATWNEVLAIDPKHTQAALYRARAQELKQRLDNLR